MSRTLSSLCLQQELLLVAELMSCERATCPLRMTTEKTWELGMLGVQGFKAGHLKFSLVIPELSCYSRYVILGRNCVSYLHRSIRMSLQVTLNKVI